MSAITSVTFHFIPPVRPEPARIAVTSRSIPVFCCSRCRQPSTPTRLQVPGAYIRPDRMRRGGSTAVVASATAQFAHSAVAPSNPGAHAAVSSLEVYPTPAPQIGITRGIVSRDGQIVGQT
jgi:hypothetical protein